jgi:beta-galactosidase
MLRTGASFSIYMACGGTTFGLWSGADRPFKPDTSSYDYDAPISEAGWPTKKFYQTRDLLSKYLRFEEKLPEPPAKNPVVAVPAVEVRESAAIFGNLPAPIADSQPRNMEQYDQGYGWILYRTKLDAGPARTLEAARVHDFGFVFLDGERIGVLDRRNSTFRIRVPERSRPARLDILVEPMGRVNFGPEVHDRKGLFGPVTMSSGTAQKSELGNWQVYPLKLDPPMLAGLRFSNARANGPAFWRARLAVKEVGDTFLDMRPWGKGVVWVNGHCLGRFWNIGPTQTMYVPGPWLKPGENEIIIADLLGPEKPLLGGLTEPLLDQLRPASDFHRVHRPDVRLDLASAKPVCIGQFEPGPAQQRIKFDAPVSGRYFCLESLSAHDGKPYAAVAELNLLDTSGQPISHERWTIAYVDTEEREREDGSAENAIDGQTANFWHTQWGSASPNHPHRLILDLGRPEKLSGFEYVPRQGAGTVAGRIKDYRIYVGDTLIRKPQ